jgi:hypothetical protein
MLRRPSRHLLVGLLALALLSGGYLASGLAGQHRNGTAVPPPAEGAGILDGMTFSGQIGPLGEPADVEDTFVFSDGLFVSSECERRCDFPARPYYVRRRGAAIEFLSETRCPAKNAKIVWRGSVQGERLSGEFTWTVDRWYWTIEKTFWFEGTLAEKAVARESDA